MSEPLIILGAGDLATCVTEIALSYEYKVVSYVDDEKANGVLNGKPIITLEAFISNPNSNAISIAIGDNYIRQQVYKQCKVLFPDFHFPILSHKTSVISSSSIIGDGTLILPSANIGPNTIIGECCLINSSSCIAHDGKFDSFSSIAPGVVIGGNVSVGKRSAISIGATIKNNINVGKDVVVGACSYVNKSISEGQIAYGVPCKEIRSRQKGESYIY